MEKLKMQTLDGVQTNIDKIAALFPSCITEKRDAQGEITHTIDFDKYNSLRNLDTYQRFVFAK